MQEAPLQTFDFYDTLVTRLVGEPADIFSLVGERLNISDFRRLRLAAEKRARRIYGGEVTFDQIYESISLPHEIRKDAYELEVELESELLVPIRNIASKFRTGDLIISDMYHKEDFFRDVLSRLMPGRIPERIYVSGSAGTSKASGLLWKRVTTDFPHHRLHVGDNPHADIKQAARYGLRTLHVTNSHLNRYEKALAEEGMDGSLLAGASKAARLSIVDSTMDEIDSAVTTVFSSVIAPVLYAFSEWVIERCIHNRIGRVFFLARDGILPFRICRALCEARGIPLDCKYIYGSRHALHLPGYTDISVAADWLLEQTRDLSLRTIARRGAIPLSLVQEAAAARHLAAEPDRIITPAELHILQSVIRDSTLVDALSQSSGNAFHAAIAYYRSVGLTKPDPAALVDIGWNGRMQRSLRALLDKSGEGPELIAGMYLCLSRRNDSDRRNTYSGYLFEKATEDDINPIYDRYRAVLEAALTSDHATTVGFEIDGVEPRPIFGDPIDESMLRRIRQQHAAIEEFTHNVIKLEKVANRRIRIPFNAIEANLRLLLTYPSEQDGIAFSNFYLSDGQTENSPKAVSKITSIQGMRLPTTAFGWWPEGTLAASGYGRICHLLQALRSVKRSLNVTLRRKGTSDI